jgi:hypothetical protein
MKRQRHVFPNREIPHLWAHQTQDHARNGNGSFYFRGATVYSWGSHFRIATHVTGVNGQRGILFTSEKNSVSTNQHISLVRRAIPPDVPVFTVPYQHLGFSEAEDKYQHERNFEYYIRTVNEHVVTCAKARSSWNKEYQHEQAVAIRAEALCYATFFGLCDPPIEMVPDLDSEQLANIKKREAKASAEKAAKAKREAEERRQKALSLADEWRAGGAHHYLLNAIPAMLRIESHEVVTSRGAHFPIMHAKRGLALVRAVMARAEEWRPNGKACRLGHYHIDRIEANGTVHAGCHVVSWHEIQRVAEDIEAYEPRIKCRQCQMLSINGVPCHETGCPNSNKTWSIEDNDWVEAELEVDHE